MFGRPEGEGEGKKATLKVRFEEPGEGGGGPRASRAWVREGEKGEGAKDESFVSLTMPCVKRY